MSKVYCTAPWNGITVREDGNVKTCCAGGISLGNLNSSSIGEILKSPKLVEIQQKMLNGQPDVKNCNFCISNRAQSGVAGLQNHYNTFYPDTNNNTFKLRNLDIRWNNVCNLGCMYCNSDLSSTWQARTNTKRSIVVHDYQDNLLDWILSNVHQVREIMLVGGEPLLMKQNHDLLSQIPDECVVSIITNLSYSLSDLPCIPHLLQRPKENTIWNVSLENTDSQFEYVRTGASWDQVKHNLMYLSNNWPEIVSINFVYSMFSAFEVVETVQTLHSLGIKKINFFSIYGNPTMDVFNMPDPIRQAAAIELKQAIQWHCENLHPEDRDLYPLQGADDLLERLSQPQHPTPITLGNFLNKIEWYNQYHDQKFEDLWPNVIDLVKKYL